MSMKYLCQSKQQYLMVMQVICRPKYFFWALLTYKSLVFVNFLCLHKLDRVEHAKSHPVHLKDFSGVYVAHPLSIPPLNRSHQLYSFSTKRIYNVYVQPSKHWSLHLGEPISMYNLNKMLIRMAVVCLYCSNVYGSV